MPCAAAPSTSWARSPTITTRSRQRVELGECVCHHVRLGGANAVQAGTRDDLEMLVEPEMREDPACGRLGLRRGHRQPHTGGAQVGQQLRDAVEQAVHRPAARGVVGAVGGDGGVGVFAESHRAQRVVHRRADDAAGQVPVGNLGADLAEGVTEAGHDALRRVGQGAIEVEDHQLRPGRRDGVIQCGHASIVSDGALLS